MVSLGENSKQEVEQHTREATSENGPGDVEEERPSESKDGASEKGSKKTEEETRETGVDLVADVKTETAPSEAPRIANTLTEEPEAQEQTKKPERVDGTSAPSAPSRTPSVAQEPQPPARATPPGLYWRRLTGRYMSVGPLPS